MTIINEAPIKNRSNVKKAELTCIKVPCKSVTRDPIKEEVPKFSGEETGEHFLHATRTIKALAERCDWWDDDTADGNSLAFETASRAMTDDALDS